MYKPFPGSALLPFLFNLRKISKREQQHSSNSVEKFLSSLTVAHAIADAPEHVPRRQNIPESPIERPRDSPPRILAHGLACARCWR